MCVCVCVCVCVCMYVCMSLSVYAACVRACVDNNAGVLCHDRWCTMCGCVTTGGAVCKVVTVTTSGVLCTDVTMSRHVVCYVWL